MKLSEHLLDHLAEALIKAPAPEYVRLQPITVRRETRMSIFQHPNSAVTFPWTQLGAAPQLAFGIAIKETVWDKIASPVQFEVLLRDERNCFWPLFSRLLDPRNQTSDRAWIDIRIDLARWAQRRVALKFKSRVAGTDMAYCWAGWSDPHVESEQEISVPRSRPDRHAHVLLITADALRADHLGCYGHPRVQTPHLDKLAREGLLFTTARTQSTTSLAAYASLFTARHPFDHGVTCEWGELPPHLPGIPDHLARHGYHTVAAVSEGELQNPGVGILDRFADVLPCRASPAQSGDVTVRAFRRWLDRRPDRPFFGWLEFFDTHPPCTSPQRFRSLYYQGDPADPSNCYQPERIKDIHGVESVIDVLSMLQARANDPIGLPVIARLADTADVLLGQRRVGPDLATHLLALGPVAWPCPSREQFGNWLRREVALLQSGVLSPTLLAWLRTLLPHLLRIEADILTWLKDVQDFRYPLAQYAAQVSHFDHHVGEVLRALQDHGLYDQTLVVVTAPHGEALGENGVLFHHHCLLESVLHVPFILKPCRSFDLPRGLRLGGIFDHIDLFPTLAEGLTRDVPADLAGTSRWHSLRNGIAIPDHDSFSSDFANVMVSLTRGDHTFMEALGNTNPIPGWHWRKGDRALFAREHAIKDRVNILPQHPQITAIMHRSLQTWLASATLKLAA